MCEYQLARTRTLISLEVVLFNMFNVVSQPLSKLRVDSDTARTRKNRAMHIATHEQEAIISLVYRADRGM